MRRTITDKFKRLALLQAFFAGAFLSAQVPYWQQRVDYTISVTLNDKSHGLSGTETIVYKNNSPSALASLFMHLWPNAYSNRRTALSKQLLEEGRRELYYATEEERGFIDSLDFAVDGKKVKWAYHPQHVDVCELILESPLVPGDSVNITTPFYVKIPDAKFSRLGHTGQAYYMTQWYPKPAVFDQKGWHPMPYLDQGEFYSEFGSFDVSITLPWNYVLAATGDRIDAAEELDFVQTRMGETKESVSKFSGEKKPFRKVDGFPPSDSKLKTVRFVQKNVHDFAWFADKRFRVMKSEVRLASGHTVDTWIYFTPGNTRLWKDALDYVNRSVLFYSKHVGEYPYRHVSAVDGTIMAGGGMEYPNITVIGDLPTPIDLDMTITHEVGHNWFYGILGSNEREHPFLDEGINSFYEMRYMREYYPNARLGGFLGFDSTFSLFGLNRAPFWKYHGLSYGFSQRRHDDQPMNLSSEQYTSRNYGSVIYSKTAVVMDYLLQLNGEEKLDGVIKKYYSDFRFRHPQPEDLEAALIEGGIADSATFNALFKTTKKINYRITRIQRGSDSVYSVHLKNKDDLASPFLLNGISDRGVGTTTTLSGFKEQREVEVGARSEAFCIDSEGRMPDIYPCDNYMRIGGWRKRDRPLRLQFISGIEDHRSRQVFFLPVIGGNHYNGLMTGLAFHNYGLFMKRFEWGVVPLYAFRSRSPAGAADLEYKFFPGGRLTFVALGAGLKTFSFFDGSLKGEDGGFAHYYRAAPYVEFHLKKEARSRIEHMIKLTSHNIKADSTGLFGWNPFRTLDYWQVNELKYVMASRNLLHPVNGEAVLQQSRDVVKLSLSFDIEPRLSKKHTLPVRVFAGLFLGGSDEAKRFYAFRASGYNGFHDYTFRHHFLGRSEHTGVGFSQFVDTDGNLKVWTPYGHSTTWMAAVNVKSPAFSPLPLRLFGDIVFCDPKFLDNDMVLWDAGINLTVIRGVIDIYYSIVESSDITKALRDNNVSYANRIRFTFNIDKLVPKRLVRELGF